MIGALPCRYLGTTDGVPSWHIARSCPRSQRAAISMAWLAWLWRQTSRNFVCASLSLRMLLHLHQFRCLSGPNRTVPDIELCFVHTVCLL